MSPSVCFCNLTSHVLSSVSDLLVCIRFAVSAWHYLELYLVCCCEALYKSFLCQADNSIVEPMYGIALVFCN